MSSSLKTLREENNQLDEQLNKENNEVVTNMIVYIRSFYISPYQQEIIRHDIYQMVLEGQLRGDDINVIIGDDYKAFCDSILEELPHRLPLYTFLSALSLICLLKAITSIIWFVSSFNEVFAGKKTWPMVPVYIGALLSSLLIILVAIFIVYYICRHSLNKQDNKKVAWMVGTVMVMTVLVNVVSQVLFHNKPIMYLHVGIVVGVIVILLLVYFGIHCYLEKQETVL